MFAAALAISPVASAPAFAQAAPQNGQKASKDSHDPNEVVCEKQEETGSRLSSHKVCMTRAQWAEQRRMNRMDIDKMQTQRGCNNGQGC
jgi:invasion protein IalB